ncbi:hypothetical protein H310_05477 [Aphanomyces invadans]|uniref:FAD-binding FR-type domain-containing protein n=1 Tax=Aphanomyces invadans TaxID=157072 RepID=A0A024UAX7_9STRA|nr:hypothetical protein H310_05477 [Aphanomyces invadans]ETW03047.1 hypothetical protein H310_05477 [Aphanomyces invadans]RHY20962.1 hypothetical protein DYB32_009928 [Aphanomyces invadans]|eukprot:XP_008868431.1 hypothetical protein H310_05477 [Aphanomyces invadans]
MGRWCWLLKGLSIAATAVAAKDCQDMESTRSIDLGTSGLYAVHSRVEQDGSLLCLKATFTGTNTTWLALGIARGNQMVSTVPANVIVFDAAKMTAKTYVVNGKGLAKVVLQEDQSSFTVINMTSESSFMSFTVSRPIAANESQPNEVDIQLEEPTNLIWAYGYKWPGKHSTRGAVLLAFSSARDTVNAGTTETPLFILGTIVAMLLTASLALRYSFKRLDHKLVPPPRYSSSCFMVQRTMSDLSVGEYILIVLYATGFLLVLFMLPFYDVDAVALERRMALAAGHLALYHLSFLIVPVSHVGWWLNLAQSRLLKFHKAMSGLFLATVLLHLSVNIQAYGLSVMWVSIPFGSQNVFPLYGFAAFVCFICMGVAAMPMVRLNLYEVFLTAHRSLFVAGIVLVFLHSRTARLALVCPLGIYAAGGIFVRLPPLFQTYTVRTTITTSHTVLLTLPLTKATQRWVTAFRLCSHAYLNVPAISAMEWHPFTIMITPTHDGVAFCIKAVKPHSFTHKVHLLAQIQDCLQVKLAGPYGQPTVDLTQYQQVVLMGGGIGVTPLLGAINYLDSHVRVKIHLCWVVRHPDELLCCQTMMFPLPHFVTSEFYVSLAISEGHIQTDNGEVVSFQPGRPNADTVLRRFQNIPDTCVVACGPEGLIVDTQREAYDRGFDFQKVVFAF